MLKNKHACISYDLLYALPQINLIAIKLLLIFMTLINAKDGNNESKAISIKEIETATGRLRTERLSEALEELKQLNFDGTAVFESVGFPEESDSDAKNNEIHFKLTDNNAVTQYFFHLKKYCDCKIGDIMQLGSPARIRYAILASQAEFKDDNLFSCSVEAFRKAVGLSAEEYPDYNKLKYSFILRHQKVIEDKLGVFYEVSPGRTGRGGRTTSINIAFKERKVEIKQPKKERKLNSKAIYNVASMREFLSDDEAPCFDVIDMSFPSVYTVKQIREIIAVASQTCSNHGETPAGWLSRVCEAIVLRPNSPYSVAPEYITKILREGIYGDRPENITNQSELTQPTAPASPFHPGDQERRSVGSMKKVLEEMKNEP